MRLLYLTTCLGLTSNYAVGGRTIGTGVCILVAVCITGVLLVMDIFVRMFVDASLVSTLGTGYTLRAVIWSDMMSFFSYRVSPSLPTSYCIPCMSYLASTLSMSLVALAQSTGAFMTLTWRVRLGLVIRLCWHYTVSLKQSLLVSLMWHLCMLWCSGDIARYCPSAEWNGHVPLLSIFFVDL